MPPSSKLLSAIAPVAASVAAVHSTQVNVTKCGALQQNVASERKNVETNPNPILTPRQLAAAVLLVRGRTVASTAAELGVSRMTVIRWKQLPAFDAEVRRRVDAMALAIDRTVSAPVTHRAEKQSSTSLDFLDQLEARSLRRHVRAESR